MAKDIRLFKRVYLTDWGFTLVSKALNLEMHVDGVVIRAT